MSLQFTLILNKYCPPATIVEATFKMLSFWTASITQKHCFFTEHEAILSTRKAKNATNFQSFILAFKRFPPFRSLSAKLPAMSCWFWIAETAVDLLLRSYLVYIYRMFCVVLSSKSNVLFLRACAMWQLTSNQSSLAITRDITKRHRVSHASHTRKTASERFDLKKTWKR